MGKIKPGESTSRGRGKYQGMNWITQVKRMAIYLRDGMACCYCGAGIDEEGTTLSLDHILPHSLGGTNSDLNLITACKTCNSIRGNRAVEEFVDALAGYRQVDASDIFLHIVNCQKRGYTQFLGQAAEILERRKG